MTRATDTHWGCPKQTGLQVTLVKGEGDTHGSRSHLKGRRAWTSRLVLSSLGPGEAKPIMGSTLSLKDVRLFFRSHRCSHDETHFSAQAGILIEMQFKGHLERRKIPPTTLPAPRPALGLQSCDHSLLTTLYLPPLLTTSRPPTFFCFYITSTLINLKSYIIFHLIDLYLLNHYPNDWQISINKYWAWGSPPP